jgi:hypothetical protein
VPGQPDVIRQLRMKLPTDWEATLLAIDGDVARGVLQQVRRVPDTASHLVVSVGGNDALGASHILGQSVGNVAEAVSLLEVAQARFAADYEAMADAVAALRLPTAFCTIYDTPPSAPDQRIIRTALAIFNDVITRTAFRRGFPLIDLRLICDRDEDYANSIEPSAAGGEKISAAIAAFVAGEGGASSRTAVFVH